MFFAFFLEPLISILHITLRIVLFFFFFFNSDFRKLLKHIKNHLAYKTLCTFSIIIFKVGSQIDGFHKFDNYCFLRWLFQPHYHNFIFIFYFIFFKPKKLLEETT